MSAGARRVLRILTASILLSSACSSIAAEPVASISSLEGRPEVARGNRFLLVDIEQGFRFEALDYVETNENTIVNLELLPHGSSPARMLVEPNTSLVLMGYRTRDDSRDGAGASPLEIELFEGSLTVSGAPVLVSRPRAKIEATTAAFSVVAGPGGGTLVLATDGIVSVVTDSGVQLFAEPGDAVEVSMADDLARVREYERATAGSFPLFWLAERRALLDSRLETHAQVVLTRYERASLAWDDAYAALMSERDLLDQWTEQDRRNLVEPISVVDFERLEPIMEEVRVQLVAYQQAVAMLESLADVHPLLVAEVSVDSGLDGAHALERIEEERRQRIRWLEQTLYALKLFQERPASPGT